MVQARASGAAITEHRLVAKLILAQTKPSQKSTRAATAELAPEPALPRPRGNLGVIVDRVAAKAGATIDELVEATGWQRHSVRGALSQLRTRGFALTLDVTADRKVYRLEPKG